MEYSDDIKASSMADDITTVRNRVGRDRCSTTAVKPQRAANTAA